VTVTEILKSMKFVVDQEGRPTAALLDMNAREVFLSTLEDIEDAEPIRERTKNWRTKEGWARWEDFEVELGADGLSALD
jgi:hypothetical protein